MVLDSNMCGCDPDGFQWCILATTACLWKRTRKTSLRDHKNMFHWRENEHSTCSFAKTMNTYLRIFDRSHLKRILTKDECIVFFDLRRFRNIFRNWGVLFAFVSFDFFYYWVGQKVHLGFSVWSDGKTQTNFVANPIFFSGCIVSWDPTCTSFCVGFAKKQHFFFF